MKVYLVFCAINYGESTEVIRAFKTKDLANEYALREVNDHWRVQDGYRPNIRFSEKNLFYGENFGLEYYVEEFEVYDGI